MILTRQATARSRHLLSKAILLSFINSVGLLIASCISNILKRFSVTAGVMLGDKDSWKEKHGRYYEWHTYLVSYTGR